MPIIEVEHLRKRCRDTVAVEDVSLTVAAGEIFGIVGPNGAGKSTTVELIQGPEVMRQRVGRLAGTLEIESEPGAGTAVFAGVPAIPREAPGA